MERRSLPSSLVFYLVFVCLFYRSRVHFARSSQSKMCQENDKNGGGVTLGNSATIDLIHDDVHTPERQNGSCSHAQIQDGRL